MNILLAVCGGIAAYKSAELIRLLRKQGSQVRVLMTASAQQFISPLTFQALSGHPVHTDLLDITQENAMGHINLAKWADVLVVAPATANCLAKFSYGLADDLVSTVYLAAVCPVYLVPAMNQAMWHKTTTQENIERLKRQGAMIIGPEAGGQACGDEGMGRMSEPLEIARQILANTLAPKAKLAGLRVLISAGPTREPIDPVRYITNRSSGKMGYALAQAAINAGADVTLVSGPVALACPRNVKLVKVETAEEMFNAVLACTAECDIYIGSAAVSDYTPTISANEKIKKQTNELTLVLHKTPDILSAVAKLKTPPFTVGFAAETHELEQYARDKLIRKNLDMIAANWVGQEEGGFDCDNNALQVYWPNGQHFLGMTDKQTLAGQLINLIALRWYEKNTA